MTTTNDVQRIETALSTKEQYSLNCHAMPAHEADASIVQALCELTKDRATLWLAKLLDEAGARRGRLQFMARPERPTTGTVVPESVHQGRARFVTLKAKTGRDLMQEAHTVAMAYAKAVHLEHDLATMRKTLDFMATHDDDPRHETGEPYETLSFMADDAQNMAEDVGLTCFRDQHFTVWADLTDEESTAVFEGF